MDKDFDGWNKRKKKTHSEDVWRAFYEREVWWMCAGLNVGVEIDGKHELFSRPVIVVRKFNKDMAVVVPTTAQVKAKNKYYFIVVGEDSKEFTVCLSQIRAISSKRLFRKIGAINKSSYEKLVEKLSEMIKGKL